jgi:hypothetical protein
MAINSTGELQSQADIYADSWEAASDRVTSALEKIYSKLINDEFMIDVTDFGASFVDTIGNIIDAFGGLKGVFTMLGTLAITVFSK